MGDIGKKFNLMKQILIILLCAILWPHGLASKTYFVHSTFGNDTNPGTSLLLPLKSLQQASKLPLQAGDSLLLAANQVFQGSLRLLGLRGKSEAPIVVSTYRIGPPTGLGPAKIDAAGHANGVLVLNCSHVIIEDLDVQAEGGIAKTKEGEIADMRCGVLVKADKEGTYEGIQLKRICISDVFYEDKGFRRGEEEVRTANGTQRYGWGIRVINRTIGAVVRDVWIQDCQVENVAHTGIKLTGRNRNIQSFWVVNCEVRYTGGPGIQMSGVKDGRISQNLVSHSGSKDDSRKWGRGSGLWTWGSSDVIIEHNRFEWANGPGDSAGCHIDFNCENVIVQYNISQHNAGGFCEILGNNHNCAYRYNLSYNDGYRVKGKEGAFQEGKIFWLSGYVGRKKKRTGPFNSYFYNNTIIVDSTIVAKFAIDRAADGLLIMNNIFYIQGKAKWVLGDQYRPDQNGINKIRRVVFTNNLFLHAEAWPQEASIQPEDKIITESAWAEASFDDLYRWVPQNSDVIKAQGLPIPKIPGDSIGLKLGLEVRHDILGQPIGKRLGIGAIQFP